jgi:DNA-binding response OmpR family regulator/HPt (histidine-containing phosphotransfer) domain-containing protein
MSPDRAQESWASEAEFLLHVEEELKKLKEMTRSVNWVNSEAWDTVVRTVHNLRGSAGMIGPQAIATILEGLERKLSQADRYSDMQLREEVDLSLMRATEALRGISSSPQAAVPQWSAVDIGAPPRSVLTPSALKRLKPLTILVVDDDPMIRVQLQGIYHKVGMRVIALDRGTDLSPEFLAKQKIDAVILDLHLPDEDGYSICKRLKADALSCNVPIVFISVTGELESRLYGWQVGAEDFIVKPVDPLELLLRVQFLVDRNNEKLMQQRQVGITYDSFLRELDKRIKEALSAKGTFVLALLSLGGAGADQKQRAAGSKFLLDGLRRGDLFCSPGPGYLIVLQPNESLASAKQTFATLARRLKREFQVECRVGLAECPTHGQTRPELMAAIKAHLDLAVQQGVEIIVESAPSRKVEEPHPPKILIVDDDPEFLNYLAKPLVELGINAIMESASDRALERVRQTSPDLVMLDVMMPDPDGLKILQSLKADPKLAAIPVIMVSVKTAEEYLIRAFDLGAADYLIKPFQLPELKARVRKVLRARAASE